MNNEMEIHRRKRYVV